MIAAIMQPYIFPYIGYFHLIQSSDIFVFYDDVSYINKGWINRNNILLNNIKHKFTIPLQKASQNLFINEIKVLQGFQEPFLKKIHHAYSKAPYFNDVFKIIERTVNKQHRNISELSIDSILSIFKYLNLNKTWRVSSSISPHTRGQQKSERLINITKQLNCNTYINLNGGRKLYEKEFFKNKDITLKFIQSNIIPYKQFNTQFLENLSIIDILMFNSKNEINTQLNSFTLD
jgi:hypothetical protein